MSEHPGVVFTEPGERTASWAGFQLSRCELSASAKGAITSTVRKVRTEKMAMNPIRKMTKVGVSVRNVPRPGERSGAVRARRRGPVRR